MRALSPPSRLLFAALLAAFGILAFGIGHAVLADAQQIPGAPLGARSLRWSDGAQDLSLYVDGGFAYPNAGGGIQGAQGSWYALADGGAKTLIAGPFDLPSQSNVEIDVYTVGAATGALQVQASNDGQHWGNVGGLQGMDGGAGAVYTFGGPGTDQQISPSGAALLRVVDSSTSTANSTVAATAFVK